MGILFEAFLSSCLMSFFVENWYTLSQVRTQEKISQFFKDEGPRLSLPHRLYSRQFYIMQAMSGKNSVFTNSRCTRPKFPTKSKTYIFWSALRPTFTWDIPPKIKLVISNLIFLILSSANMAAVWVKAISSWLCFGIYMWTLIAPVVLPDRDFSV